MKWEGDGLPPPPPGEPPRPLTAGSTVVYNIAVVNNGPSDASSARIIDTLPPGVTFVSTDPPDFCTLTPPDQLVCDMPFAIQPNVGIFVPVTVRLDADLADGSLLTNTAQVLLTDPTRVDPVSSNNFAALTNPIVTAADLNVVKSTYSLDLPSFGFTTPSAAPAGTPTGYFIDVRNDGPSVARDVTVVDSSTMTDFFLNQVRLIRPGLDPESIDITAQCSFSGGSLQCPLGDLPVFASGEASWRIQVDGVTLSDAAPGTYENTATLTSTTPDTDASDNSSTAPITVTAPVATLTIDKTNITDNGLIQHTLVPGTDFGYQLSVENVFDPNREGAADADGVIVTDTLPPGLTPTAVSGSQGSCTITLPSTVTCNLGTVLGPGRVPAPPPALITIRGTIAANATGPVTNTATVTSPISAPASDSLELPVVPFADMAITKIPDSTEAAAGSAVGFNLVVTNAGPSDALDVEAIDLLPPELTPDAALTDPSCGFEVNGDFRFFRCPIGDLAIGETRTVRVVGRLDPAQPPGTFTNSGFVVSLPTGDAIPENNESAVPITITQAADLVVTKVADAQSVAVGNQVTYTVTATNAGPSNASAVEVTDEIPPGLTFVDARHPNAPRLRPR